MSTAARIIASAITIAGSSLVGMTSFGIAEAIDSPSGFSANSPISFRLAAISAASRAASKISLCNYKIDEILVPYAGGKLVVNSHLSSLTNAPKPGDISMTYHISALDAGNRHLYNGPEHDIPSICIQNLLQHPVPTG
jgi:hypothetical protein